MSMYGDIMDKINDSLFEDNKEKITVKRIIGHVLLIIFVLFISFYEFPYYIDTPGGLDNLNERIPIEDGYKAKGSINLTYVSEVKGTLPLLLIAAILPDWDIEPKESVDLGTLDYKSNMVRQRILMKQSYTTAIKLAYEKAHKDIKVTKENCYVIYVFEEAKTNLEVGDMIVKIDDVDIKTATDITDILSKHQVGDKITITILNNDKEKKKEATLIDDGTGKVSIGLQVTSEYILESNPKFKLDYNNMEFGPSGGLMISLAVYNSLVKEDITGGKVIAGTGTLNDNGYVGPIGGIEYKLKGAVNAHADIFFVPSEENYDEAIKIKEKKHYKIKIVKVDTFDDALEYLEKNVMKK